MTYDKRPGKMPRVPKRRSQSDREATLLRKHRLHAGVYQRVAQRLGTDPSYVSKVASGKRISVKIYRALLEELQRIERM
jgi:transcriptional regulator with XRE-family HTH domain